MTTTWALEEPPNPRSLLLHTKLELTTRTIEKCPPSPAPVPLDPLLRLAGVRSLDLHRYRARLNLAPNADRKRLRIDAEERLARVWGTPTHLPEPPQGRRFAVAGGEERLVAESLEMASGHPVLRTLFTVPGVAEAILEHGGVVVRIGRIFSWRDVEPLVVRGLQRHLP